MPTSIHTAASHALNRTPTRRGTAPTTTTNLQRYFIYTPSCRARELQESSKGGEERRCSHCPPS
uniref:Uncharacterized protein n=1 Tax=Triticum urartu TaxID=4572 RepID=A0A8R7TV89_TRIUA